MSNNEWKPIETAPKDGTRVLVAVKTNVVERLKLIEHDGNTYIVPVKEGG